MEGSWHRYGDQLEDVHQGRSHGSNNQQAEGTLEITYYGRVLRNDHFWMFGISFGLTCYMIQS